MKKADPPPIGKAQRLLMKWTRKPRAVMDDMMFYLEDIKYELRKRLLDDCDVHAVVRLPAGVFAPYAETVKTNLVFFTKGSPTAQIRAVDADRPCKMADRNR